MPRNEFHQLVSGGPVRQPYSSSVPSTHWLFKNSSSTIVVVYARVRWRGEAANRAVEAMLVYEGLEDGLCCDTEKKKNKLLHTMTDTIKHPGYIIFRIHTKMNQPNTTTIFSQPNRALQYLYWVLEHVYLYWAIKALKSRHNALAYLFSSCLP